MKFKDDLKNYLKNVFQMKDLGPVDLILGKKIVRDRKSGNLTIKHRRYLEDIL